MLKATFNREIGLYECKGYVIARPGPDNTQWIAVLASDKTKERYPTLETHLQAKTLSALRLAIGIQKVKTRNILNPNSKEFDICWEDKGGCCDPGTETYHCM